ncbi:MAG TPA: hypothetical protein VGR73_01195 [Bryobacteraceae bacterium]|nr:hypothetical protein [Bryobacteraceae bacterium]
MKSAVVLLPIVASLIGGPLAAQWANYPTPSIPRTADGKPNLTAPAPRTPDGKPDLSGLWDKISPKYGRNIAADLKPGEVQPWAEALAQQRSEDLGKDYMGALCLPLGPSYMTNGGSTAAGMVKIVQTPTLILFLHPDLTYRQIFLDGRQLEKDPNPSWMGYSVGHWEGDTLVVESNGYNARTWLDRSGHPHTEALRVTERYHRKDFGHIEIGATIQDPAIYAKPWDISLNAQFLGDTEIIEYVCNENVKTISYREHWVGKASDDKKTEVHLAPEILAKYAGTYRELDIWNGGPIPRTIEITVADGALYADLKGRGKVRLVAQSPTLFTGFFGLGIGFLLDSQGHVTHLTEQHVSGDYRFIRLN